MNKQGQVMIYGIMLGLTIIILALALSPAVRDFTQSARNETSGDVVGLNCSTTTNNFDKATCIVTDLNLFYFVSALIFIAGSVIVAKIIFE